MKYISRSIIELGFSSNEKVNLNIISSLLKLEASECYMKGDQTSSMAAARFSVWNYTFADCNAYEEQDENLSKLITFLNSKSNELKEIRNVVDYFLVEVIIYKQKRDSVGLRLNPTEMMTFSSLGFDLSITIYDYKSK